MDVCREVISSREVPTSALPLHTARTVTLHEAENQGLQETKYYRQAHIESKYRTKLPPDHRSQVKLSNINIKLFKY